MGVVLSFLSRIAWTLFPRLIGAVVDHVEMCLQLVEAAQNMLNLDAAGKRNYILKGLGGAVPEGVLRWEIEFCLLLYRMGVTATVLDQMQQLVGSYGMTALTNTEKRNACLAEFLKLCSGVPENLARLLLQMAVARLKSSMGTTTPTVSGSGSGSPDGTAYPVPHGIPPTDSAC